ncbi:PilW family protein, partial [Desulfobacterales bacterium HSG2]|nr:PilW family protein [Desulfobacterales bacterium HSG2]
FSLIEIMVVIDISSIFAAALYSFYDYHQKIYAVQQEIVSMQQNLRAAMYYMEDEIRMAGYDPTRKAGAEIETAEAEKIYFSFVADDDGNDNDDDDVTDEDGELEKIEYYFNEVDGIKKLLRKEEAEAVSQPVAEYVDALNFVYLDDDGNVLDDDGEGSVTGNNIFKIRSVQVTLVVRGEREDLNYKDNVPYTNQQGDEILAPQNDHYHRRVLTSEIRCRNIGLPKQI